ncbi:MAG TPA: hypothetical protein VEC57_00140 [Candidatus Limnocylindrales bacterium]|nr:hypothetical protein [Candidatus Limnocylindrales bacterium]
MAQTAHVNHGFFHTAYDGRRKSYSSPLLTVDIPNATLLTPKVHDAIFRLHELAYAEYKEHREIAALELIDAAMQRKAP